MGSLPVGGFTLALIAKTSEDAASANAEVLRMLGCLSATSKMGWPWLSKKSKLSINHGIGGLAPPVKASLGKIFNPKLLLMVRPEPCMVTHCHWCVNG